MATYYTTLAELAQQEKTLIAQWREVMDLPRDNPHRIAASCRLDDFRNNHLRPARERALQGPPARGIAFIGRSGVKAHPVQVQSDGHLFFRCSCTGTANGFARNSIRGLQLGTELRHTCNT
jgi:hypothetical protein